MTESKGAVLAYPRLCIAFFCQFAIWGAWMAALGGYIGGVLNFEGWQMAWIYGAMPIGAVIAPLLIGPIADRYFASQKVMAVLHLISGLTLLACYWLCESGMMENLFIPLLVLMLLQGLCYTPTMGLMNAIVFKHLPKPSMAPYVFVFGTIGWIVATLWVAAVDGRAETPFFFLLAGGISVFLALYSLTLPHTPPKGAPVIGGEKTSAFAVLSLFKNYAFCVFIICAFLASIPANNYFWPWLVPFLSERGYPSPVALVSLNQFSEIIFMLALAFCIPRLGLKNVLLIGMAAWSLRYFLFSIPLFEMALLGLLLHGFCYAFLYVAAYMYADKVAPDHLKASAQSMMIFLLVGVSQLIGGFGVGYMVDKNPPRLTAIEVQATQIDPMPASIDATDTVFVPIPAWSAEDTWHRHLDLTSHVNRWLESRRGDTDDQVVEAAPARTVDIGELLAAQGERRLTPATIDAMDREKLIQDGVDISQIQDCCGDELIDVEPGTVVTVQFTRDSLKAFAREVARTDGDFSLSREDWLAAQARDWSQIYIVPAFIIAGCFFLFLVFGREPKDDLPKVETEDAGKTTEPQS